MKHSLFFAIVFSIVNLTISAQQKISGTVNNYHSVSQINPATQSVVLSNSSSIQAGDLVLIIQMKGATINETMSNSFDTIQSYNGAGNYEFHTVCRVSGNELFFQNSITKSYDKDGLVQVIEVPEYFSGATLNGNLTGNAWDGNIGGVLALKINGSLKLDTFDIDMSGKGFRGGQALLSGGGCIFLSSTAQYSAKSSANARALKGEGIAEYILNKECSRGPQANGGGGGGSNYGVGGSGGQRIQASVGKCGSVVGFDSKSLSSAYSQSKVFMGGGGGAGHGNNAGLIGESGENGGGIIFIIADTIIGNNGKIMANGISGSLHSENEGGGGGGAGGSIILQFEQIGSHISTEAYGGAGVNVENFPNTNCSGAGGGAGGGVVAISQSSLPSILSVNTAGGKSGIVAKSTQPGCAVGSTNGAKAGTNGSTLFSYSISDQSGVNPPTSASINACNKYISPSGKYLWKSSGQYADTTLNRAGCDSILDINLTIVPVDTGITLEEYTLVASSSGTNYQWMGCSSKKIITGETSQTYTPTTNGSFAVIVGSGGCFDTSACLSVVNIGIEQMDYSNQISVFPNPSEGVFTLTLPSSLKSYSGKIYSVSGNLVAHFNSESSSSITFEIPIIGIYILELNIGNQIYYKKLVRD